MEVITPRPELIPVYWRQRPYWEYLRQLAGNLERGKAGEREAMSYHAALAICCFKPPREWPNYFNNLRPEGRRPDCATAAVCDAAETGHVELLECLFAHGFTADFACAAKRAVVRGRVAALALLESRARGFAAYDQRVLRAAAVDAGQTSVLEWMAGRGWLEGGGALLERAARAGRADVVEALVRAGLWPDGLPPRGPELGEAAVAVINYLAPQPSNRR